MTDNELAAEIERLNQAATSAPWEICRKNYATGVTRTIEDGKNSALYSTIARVMNRNSMKAGEGTAETDANIELLVTLRNSVPAILTALRAAAAPAGVSLAITDEVIRQYITDLRTPVGLRNAVEITQTQSLQKRAADIIEKLSLALAHAERARAAAEEVAKGMREALTMAAAQFDFYAGNHDQKADQAHTPLAERDARNKAETNRKMAAVCRRAALKPGQDAGAG